MSQTRSDNHTNNKIGLVVKLLTITVFMTVLTGTITIEQQQQLPSEMLAKAKTLDKDHY